MQQRDFDASMSKIFTGPEMISVFKDKGVGPENFEVFKVKFKLKYCRCFGRNDTMLYQSRKTKVSCLLKTREKKMRKRTIPNLNM